MLSDRHAPGDDPRPLLMTRDNPGGYKLEDLLEQILCELSEKTGKLRQHVRTEAFAQQSDLQQSTTRALIHNNQEIAKLLRGAFDRQMMSQGMLDRIAADPGPRGQPRIGEGSPVQVAVPMERPIETTGHDDC